MTKKRRTSSYGEDDHSRIVGAGFSGAGCLGDEATPQRSRVYLQMGLHISLLSVMCKIKGLGYPDTGNIQPF
jgi:hypothetical protein